MNYIYFQSKNRFYYKYYNLLHAIFAIFIGKLVNEFPEDVKIELPNSSSIFAFQLVLPAIDKVRGKFKH
jgi:hypothetical protein